MGDELLRVVADRLRRAVRPGDTLSRFGGDEFVVVLEGITSPDDATQVAERDPRGPHRAGGVQREPRGRSHDEHRDGPEPVVRFHDGRPHPRSRCRHVSGQAARPGRCGCRVRGGPRSQVRAVEAADPPDLETALLHAVERGEVVVHFQPVVSLVDQRIVGAEALVRWNHPQHGLLAPPQFIELAEGNGAILPIGRYVLEQACRLAKTWRERLGVTLWVGREPVVPSVPAAGTGGRGGRRAGGDRCRPVAGVPRDHREPGHVRRRADGDHLVHPPRISASVSPSTTSAPATPRSAIWRSSPSTSSRSTRASRATSTRTR